MGPPPGPAGCAPAPLGADPWPRHAIASCIPRFSPRGPPGSVFDGFSACLRSTPRPARGPRLFVCCPARCLPASESSDPVPTVRSSLRSTPSVVNALCRLAPRPVIGRPPNIAAGRPPPGGPVRSTPERTMLSSILYGPFYFCVTDFNPARPVLGNEHNHDSDLVTLHVRRVTSALRPVVPCRYRNLNQLGSVLPA